MFDRAETNVGTEMDVMRPATVPDALADAVAADPARPLLTYYDDATGERTELSGATLANWVAKTANLLWDGLALGAGDTAAVHLPPHWQTAAVLLGCWCAGLTVDLAGTPGEGTAGGGTAGAATAGAATARVGMARPPAAVAFATVDRLAEVDADETFVLALTPLAAPLRPGPPPGTLDFVVEVRGHGDQFVPATPTRPDATALADGTSQAGLVAAASARAEAAGTGAGARVLVDGDTHTELVDWLLAPLVVGASVVLCRHLDAARLPARLASERATPYH